MKVTNLYSSDPILGDVIFFQNHAELFRRMSFSSPSEVPRSKRSAEVTVAAKETFRRKTEDPFTQSPMEELFELKRAEKPPENFMRDFLKEFHRRNPSSGPKQRS